MFSRNLIKQLAITMCFFIIAVESIYLFHSFEAKRNELIDIRRVLDEDVMKKAGKRFNDLHPDILSDADIERRLQEFRLEGAWVALILTIVVVLGTNAVVYWLVGSPLMRLISITRSSKAEDILRYKGNIPSNELGELITARETQLDLIEDYQRQLSGEIEVLGSQLNQSAKLSLVGELTAGIIHDINNPLQVLYYHLEKAEDKGEYKEKDVAKMLKALDRVNALVKRMTSFVRTRANEKSEYLIKELVDDVLVILESKIKKHRIEIKENYLVETKIKIYKQDFEQVLMNLVSNAIDAMVEADVTKPMVEIKVEDINGLLKIQVIDNGPGIPEEIQSQIFDSFFTTKKDGKGTGLGLSNVSRIVEQIGGRISVQNKEGYGAMFEIQIEASV